MVRLHGEKNSTPLRRAYTISRWPILEIGTRFMLSVGSHKDRKRVELRQYFHQSKTAKRGILSHYERKFGGLNNARTHGIICWIVALQGVLRQLRTLVRIVVSSIHLVVLSEHKRMRTNI